MGGGLFAVPRPGLRACPQSAGASMVTIIPISSRLIFTSGPSSRNSLAASAIANSLMRGASLTLPAFLNSATRSSVPVYRGVLHSNSSRFRAALGGNALHLTLDFSLAFHREPNSAIFLSSLKPNRGAPALRAPLRRFAPCGHSGLQPCACRDAPGSAPRRVRGVPFITAWLAHVWRN